MNNISSDKILVILGMHRSGTSLITQWLTKMGLSVGERLIGPGNGNSDGHFEDIDFCNLHQEILMENNLPDTGLIPESVNDVPADYKKQLLNVIGLKSMMNPAFGWKDPRTCLFLKTYRELLPAARYLVIVRNYQEVVTSLLRREFYHVENDWLVQHSAPFKRLKWNLYKKDRHFREFADVQADCFLRVYNHYNRELLSHLKQVSNKKFIVVNYKKLILNDRQLFMHFTNVWQFDFNFVPYSSVYKPQLISKEFNVDNHLAPELVKDARALEMQLMKYAF